LGILGKGPKLRPAIDAFIQRIRELDPVEGDKRDADTCSAIRGIIDQSNWDLDQLAKEIDATFRQTATRRFMSKILPWLDKKSDVAVEAAVATATNYALRGGL